MLTVAAPLVVLLGIVAVTDVPLCPTRLAFGVPCPGCGLTRATLALLRGDFAAVLRLHPLAPILAPLLLWGLATSALASAGLVGAARWDPTRILPRWGWALLGLALLGLYAARLAGALGGLPDPVDLRAGVIGRVLVAIARVP